MAHAFYDAAPAQRTTYVALSVIADKGVAAAAATTDNLYEASAGVDSNNEKRKKRLFDLLYSPKNVQATPWNPFTVLV